MSQRPTDALDADILFEAQRLKQPVSTEAASKIAHYFDLLGRWTAKIRTAGSADPATLMRRHFADSLTLLQLLPRRKSLRCIDVGSGGGLPALPLLILRPDLQLTLVESRSRKCALLRTAAQELDLACTVCNQRLEALDIGSHADAEIAPFDAAWSLATFAPSAWVQIGSELITNEGVVVVFTARDFAGDARHVRVRNTIEYTLADGTPRVATAYGHT